jgi:5-methylcytosine-specific restriction enzyme subunit McrC
VIARQGLPIPIDYTYDEFTPDNSLNRLLVRALHAVLDLAMPDFAVHTEARALLTGFAGVQFELNPTLYRGDDLPSRVAHYQDALVLATMILEGVGLEPLAADHRARGLLFDMNRVFEDFVTAVATRTAARGISVDAQGRNHPRFLDSERRFRIKPDLAIWSRSGCLLVGDVKYKLLDDSHAIRRPDLYQISAYAATLETTEAVLLYVGTGADDEVHIEQPPVRVRARAVDLDQGIEAAELRIAEILWAHRSGSPQVNIA